MVKKFKDFSASLYMSFIYLVYAPKGFRIMNFEFVYPICLNPTIFRCIFALPTFSPKICVYVFPAKDNV